MTELEEPVLTLLLNRMFLPKEQRDAKKADDAAERAKKPVGVLEGALEGREYLLGNAFSVADLNVSAVLSWAPMAGFDLGGTPSVAGWFARCTERPALGRVMQKG